METPTVTNNQPLSHQHKMEANVEYLLNKYHSSKSNKEEQERLAFLKQTRTFRALPLHILEKAAKYFQVITVQQGEWVAKQDSRTDYFHLLLEGNAAVWREDFDDDEPHKIAHLKSGDSFGEEGLITACGDSASIKMLSDGVLLRLSKDNFMALIVTPSLRTVSPDIAQVMAKNGAQIIDVRNESEHQLCAIPNSTLLPLPELSHHLNHFDKETEYLILCAVGLRASVAALLLGQHNIKATVIEHGLKNWTFEEETTMDLELILFDFCPFAQRIVISLKHSQVPYRLTYLDPNNLPDWFAEVSPFGKVPILRVNKETTIFESSVINELVASISQKKMLPENLIEMSLCRSWIEFGSTLLSQLTGMIASADKDSFDHLHNSFIKNLQLLEQQVAPNSTYFMGDSFTLVDSTYAPLFMRMMYLNKSINLYLETDFPHITHWAKSITQLDVVTQSIPRSFNDIYAEFIQRRGEHGYLLNTLTRNNTKLSARAA